MPGFPHSAADSPHLCMGFFSSMFCPSPLRQRGNDPSVGLATTFCPGWGAIGSPAALEYVVPSPPKQCVVLTWQVFRLAQVKLGQLQGSTGRHQTEVLCPHVFGGSRSSQMLAVLFLHFSALGLTCSQPVNRKVGWRLPDPMPGCNAL
jgi:hypothetical protein